MPSLSERSRNNVRAGIFVSASIMLAIVVILALTEAWHWYFLPTQTYTVTFDVSWGVSNLQEGGDVRVGGMSLGTVEDVRAVIENGPMRIIEVTFTLDQKIQLFNDAQIIVSSPLIGSEAWLDIPDVGKKDEGKPVGNHLIGQPNSGALGTLLGPGNADKAENFVEFIGGFSDEYDTEIKPIIRNVNETSETVRNVVNQVENRWDEWSKGVDFVVHWAADATVKFDHLVDNVDGGVTDYRDMVKVNRPNIDRTIANIADVSDHAKNEWVRQVDALLSRGQGAMDAASSVINNVETSYAGWKTTITDILANLSITGQQLKLASIEIRRNPWKMTYEPSRTELEHEGLYDAARSFAFAAADLKTTSSSIQSILELHDGQLPDHVQFKEIMTDFQEKIKMYEDAQKELLAILRDETPGP